MRLLRNAQTTWVNKNNRILACVCVQVCLATCQSEWVWTQETPFGGGIEPRPHEVEPIRLRHHAELADKLKGVRDRAGGGHRFAEWQITVQVLIGSQSP